MTSVVTAIMRVRWLVMNVSLADNTDTAVIWLKHRKSGYDAYSGRQRAFSLEDV